MAFTLTVTGEGFTAQSVIKIAGADQTTVMNSHTELECEVDDATVADIGNLSVTVVNPAPGGGTSNAAILSVVAGNPVPAITTLTPDEIDEDEATFTVTITGTGFIATSQARWEGSNRTTTYNSATEIEVEILDTDITADGVYQIDVVNPTPGGGTSNAADFTVNDVAALWTPASITTQLWLDASDSSTITIATGVSQWDDKSGNSRHVVQGTGANQPAHNSTTLNSLPVVTFDGTDDALRSSGTVSGLMQNVSTASIFVLANQTAAPTNDGTSDVLFTIADNAGTQRRAVIYHTPIGLENPPRLRCGGHRTDASGLFQIGNPVGAGSFAAWRLFSMPLDYANDDGFLYINGTLSATNTAFTGSSGSTSNTAAGSLNVGCDVTATPQRFLGHIAEMIVTHSVSAYQRFLVEGYLAHKWAQSGNLPATHPFKNHAPIAGDPNFANVILLLHGEGTNAGTVVTDGGVNNRTMTVGSGVTTVTAQQKFGASSIRVTSVGSGGILAAGTNANDLTTQDFTIEMFVRFNSVTPQQCFIAQYSFADGNRAWFFRLNTGPNLQFGYYTTGSESSGVSTSASWSPSTNTWYHVAVCRSGSDLRMFVDGTQVGTTHNISTASIAAVTADYSIGGFFATTGNYAQAVDGWLDEVRVTLGTARYTANFTPPVAQFPDAV